MLVIQFIVISIIFGVSCADVDNNNLSDGNFEYVVNEGSSWSDKISATLRNEIDKLKDVNKKILENLEVLNRKMDGSKIKITDKLDDIKNKFDVFEKINHEFDEKTEESLNNIFHKLQKNIDEKLESFDQHVYRQLYALEKMIEEKPGITIINNNKLSASEKKQPELEENIMISKPKTTGNETLEKLNNNVTKKLNAMEIKISELENNTSYSKFDDLGIKIMNLKNNFDRTELTHNFTKINRTSGYWDCKKLEAHGYDYKPIRMDNETFDHITLESDEDGLIYFEMHLAIESEGLTVIQLSSEANPRKEDGYFAIGIADGHARSWIYNVKPRDDDNDIIYLAEELQSARTPADIITPNDFKAFYVRIINQTLQFGSEGTDSPPILRYRDERFRTLKYIGFTSWGDYYTGSFLYDCPPKFEESLS